MKKLIFLFILVLFSSCEIHYNGEQRYIVNAHLIDTNGNPISNEYVNINCNVSPLFITDHYSDLISFGKTDSQGNITLLFPSNDKTFEINIGSYESSDSVYMKTTLGNLKLANFENHQITLNSFTLYKPEEVTPFKVNLEHNSFDTKLISLKVEGHTSYDAYYFNSIPNDEYFYYENYFSVVKNKNFNLKYIIKNTSTNIETTYSIDFSAGNDPINYTIIY